MLSSAGVIGAGTMGVGIAYVLALAEVETIVVEPDDDRAAALAAVLAEQARAAVERGKLSDADARALPGRVARVARLDQLPSGLGLLLETVPERLELKLEVLAAAERSAPLLLASNTSSISIDRLASALERPDRFIGMHFFNPVWSLALVELIRGTQTNEATVRAARDVVAHIGKQSILVCDVPGFATTRLDLALSLEAIRMVQDGVASVEDIDKAAVLAYRHPVGPLRLTDIVGLDVRLDICRSLSETHGERFAPPQLLIEKVRAGELGRKSGRGFYDWDRAES